MASEQALGYHVAKAGLMQMARYYAVKLGPKGIRVNAVSSDAIIKPEARAFYRKNRRIPALYRKITPLRRMGTAEDAVHAIDFLCSSKASFVTGHNLLVDGGLSLKSQGSLAKELTGLG